MIQVNGLKKAFDGFVALNGVDMHVEKGAIYGLVGPNGAGKSTLIRHLTGVYRPDQGEVQIDGENVYENKADRIWRKMISSCSSMTSACHSFFVSSSI